MKPLWIGVGAVVVIAVIAGVAVRGGNKGVTSTESPAASSSAAPTTQAATGGSLKDLLALGGSQTCTFSDAAGASTGSGIVYVNSGNVRGDFTTVVGSKSTVMHMIVKDQTSYMWGDALQGGIKMSLATLTQSASPAPQAKSLDVNQNVNYSCAPWITDASKFELPAGVQFTDLSTMMQGQGASGTAAQCAQCDQAGSAKAQCRAALGCK